MFNVLFKQKLLGQKDETAEDLYKEARLKTREPTFYTEYGVPDTFDGRFDLLLLHIFLDLHRLMGQESYARISQDLFDITFRDMDQTLREMGIGDMGVPKHMKRMMKAFNGRMHAYKDALEGEEDLKEVLRRNLYGTLDEIDDKKLSKMVEYVKKEARS